MEISHLEIASVVNSQIDKFNITEFCPNGGWPKFDDLEIQVFSITSQGEHFIVDVEIIYQCETPGCCFIPGQDKDDRLRKTVIITNEMELVVS